MILEVLLLVLGFVLLVRGADIFVGASVNIAKKLRIPSVVIGLTVVAIGTSAPEAVISATASAKGSNALAIGNAIGSNMFNLLLIVGVCALIKPFAVKFKEISRDFWVSTGAVAVLLIMVAISKDFIPRLYSLLLFLSFIIYMVLLVRKTLKDKPIEEQKVEEPPMKRKPLSSNVLLAFVGCGLIIWGGQFTVNSASDLALRFGISERMIGLTVIAIGTSLPELVVSLVACKKGEGEVALGNVIGSSIFNILLVLGIAGMISPLQVNTSVIYDLAILTAGCLISLFFAYSSQRVVRTEGFLMVLMYISYMLFVIRFS